MSESDEETRSPRILLVVTGDLEELAFKPALDKVFPTAYFETRRVSGLTSQGSLVASDSRPGGAKAYPIVNELLGAPLSRIPGELGVVEPAPHARLVRALLDDIAHMVGSRPPWLKPGPLHPLTCLKPGGTLRNIL